MICYALSKARLNSHRGKRLKRKFPDEQEDREMKRRMLALMEANVLATIINCVKLAQMNTRMDEITKSIKDGFSLIVQVFQQLNESNFAPPQQRSSTSTLYS